MAEYFLNGATLLSLWKRSGADGTDESILLYAEATRCFGPALPFFLTRQGLEAYPYDELGGRRILPEDLTPLPGEMWIIFCYKEGSRPSIAAGTPLRTDGFMLVLEWRREEADSPLLSSAFHALAALVRKQQGISGWGLHPAMGRYQDKVDFTDRDLFSDGEHVADVASAYGALAAGLLCAESNSYPREWAFPSIQWDSDLGRIAAVAGLSQKLSVVADCGGRMVAVASEQVPQAERELAALKEQDAARYGSLRIQGVRSWRRFDRQARAIAFCADNEQRRCRRLLVSAAGAVTATGALLWGMSESQRRQETERDRLVVEAAPLLADAASGAAFGTVAEGLLKLGACAEDADVRKMLINQVRMRSWLVPVGVDETHRRTYDAHAVYDLLKKTDEVIASAEAVLKDTDGRLARKSDLARVKVPEGWPIEYRSVSGMLSAVRRDTGEVLWKSPMGFQVFDGEVIGRDNLLLVRAYAPKLAVQALDAFRGNVVWSRSTGTMLKQAVTSPDGRYWALLSQDRQVSVLETRTGRPAVETVRVAPDVLEIKFLPDSRQLLLVGAQRSVVCRICLSRMLVEIERPGDLLLDWHVTEDGTCIEQDVQFLLSEEQIAELQARYSRGEEVSPDELAPRLERQTYDLKTARVISTRKIPEVGDGWSPPNETLPFEPPALTERWKRLPSVGWAFGTRLTRQVTVCDGKGEKIWCTAPYATPGVIPFNVDSRGRFLAVGVANDEVQLLDAKSGRAVSPRWKTADGISCIVCAQMDGEDLVFVGGGSANAIKDGPGYFSLYDARFGVKCLEVSGTKHRIKRCAIDARGNVLFDNGEGTALLGLMQPGKTDELTAGEVRSLVGGLVRLSFDREAICGNLTLLDRLGMNPGK